ncbi:MAG: DUF6463 family protein [Myxococcota bacterium]
MHNVTSGFVLVATGAIHCIFGLVIGWEPLTAAVADGVIGAFADAPRKAMFWFEFGGVMMILFGALMHAMESRGSPLPRWVGYSLATVGIGGGLCIPASGFWLIVPQGFWVVRRGATPRP